MEDCDPSTAKTLVESRRFSCIKLHHMYDHLKDIDINAGKLELETPFTKLLRTGSINADSLTVRSCYEKFPRAPTMVRSVYSLILH